MLAAIAARTLLWLRRMKAATEPAAALRCETPAPAILIIAFAVVFLCAALVVLFTAEISRFPMLQRVFGAAAIFGGLCIPFLLLKQDGSIRSASGTATVILTFFCCFWLIFAYKLNAEDPVIWAYGPELLALAATTVGIYEVSAYYHGKARPAYAFIALHTGAFLDLSVLFDLRSAAMTVMIGICAALMLLLSYLLIANLKESGD